MKKPDPALIDDENPEWTEAMFDKAKRGTAAARRRPGRPAGSSKVSTTIRFDKVVLEAFKRSGPGWQSRINTVLREYVEKQHL